MAHYAPQTLRRLLETGSMPVQAALDFGGQLAEALAALHAQGRCFGVLTPESIRITSDGHAELLAPQAEEPGPYRAPESGPSMLADQYSLGLILGEMLTGLPPASAPQNLESLRSHAPEALLQLVSRMTARDPQQRFPGMREVAEQLHGLKVNWHVPHLSKAAQGAVWAFLILFGAIAALVWFTHR